MGLPEALLVIYLPIWLLAVADATIAKFDRWYIQFGWLLAMFLVPGAPIAYLLFGVRQTARGGFGFLRRKPKNRTQEPNPRTGTFLELPQKWDTLRALASFALGPVFEFIGACQEGHG